MELRPVVIVGRDTNILQWRELLDTNRIRVKKEWVSVPKYGKTLAELERPHENWEGSIRDYVLKYLPEPTNGS